MSHICALRALNSVFPRFSVSIITMASTDYLQFCLQCWIGLLKWIIGRLRCIITPPPLLPPSHSPPTVPLSLQASIVVLFCNCSQCFMHTAITLTVAWKFGITRQRFSFSLIFSVLLWLLSHCPCHSIVNFGRVFLWFDSQIWTRSLPIIFTLLLYEIVLYHTLGPGPI